MKIVKKKSSKVSSFTHAYDRFGANTVAFFLTIVRKKSALLKSSYDLFIVLKNKLKSIRNDLRKLKKMDLNPSF